ncbi:MAG TPA: hypothetical protein VHI78_02830 [Bacteroidales bacterium]|jgi:hypothetical protein|nr:hypothetical protein [Bacteroidales bacterium]
MRNQYWIVGDWNKIIEEEQLEQHALENSKTGSIEQFSDTSGKFIYCRRKLGKRTVIIEFNTSTGEKLLLTPLEEALGNDILRPEWSDVFLDFISKKSKVLGYWPLRQINLPIEDQIPGPGL